jgi:hypothetical protein
MMPYSKRWPSPALVLGGLALIVALGGTSYAALKLPANSVTSAQVKNGSLLKKDFKAGQLPSGPRGLTGTTGAVGPAGSTGPAGVQGAKGDPGDPTALAASGDVYSGQLSAVLPSDYSLVITGGTFPRPLAAGVPTPTVDWRAGAVADANCPGIGTAAVAGVICVYDYNSSTVTSLVMSGGAGGENKRYGFSLDVFHSATNGYFVANWTYKVP